MSIEPEKEPERDALISIYDHTHSEISRYRDIEWKIAGWTVTVLAGILTLIEIDVFPTEDQGVFQITLSIVIGIIAGYGCWHLHFVHSQFTANKKLRRQLENRLNLTPLLDCWGFIDAERKIYYRHGVAHLISWWTLIVVFAAYIVLAIWN